MKIGKKGLYLIMTAAAFIAIVAGFQVASCYNKGGDAFGSGKESPLKNNPDVQKAVELQNAFRGIYELYKESVVFISTEQTVKLPSHPFFDDPFFRDFFGNSRQQQPRTEKRRGLGTGFILSEDGYIATNQHVVKGVDKIDVKINERHYKATVVGSDERTDLALLKINSDKKFTPVYLGDSETVRVGDWAIAIGNPFGLDKTYTVGHVSAAARKDVELMGQTQSHIQTDASINPGNSGGPLINIYGEVIGINRMIYSNSGGSLGIGFAIPINSARMVLDELKKNKKIKRGFIGVQIVPLTEEYAKELGLAGTEGALVGAVVEKSPAEKGGVKVGDVILKINDRDIKSIGDILDEVEKTPVGKTIKVIAWREKAKITLFLTVAERN